MSTAARVASCLAVLAVAVFAPARNARAQAADRCEVVITPSTGRTIPANAPALHYFVAAIGSNIPQEVYSAPVGIQLFNGAGASVAVTVNDDPFYGYRIEPATPFAAGQTYRLRYPDPCAGSGVFAEAQIPIGPAAPWPSASGTLRLTAATGDLTYSCFDLPYILRGHPGLRIQITPSAELQPFLPVVLFEPRVDAFPWYRSAYGGMPHWYATLPGIIQHADDTLYAECGRMGEGDPQNDCPNNTDGLAPGTHRLMVGVYILGSTVDPQPFYADITLDCDTGGSGSAGTGGAGTSGGTGTGGTRGSGGGGGCAIGGGAFPGPAAAWLLMMILGACRSSVRRRRR